MAIKAIETVYKGYRFRSRLEARWAVFFDSSGIAWEYEPEGYQLSNGERYLPDFYLPKERLYVEVKGVQPDEIYRNMLERFAEESGKAVLKVVGVPSNKPNEIYCFDFTDSSGGVGWHYVRVMTEHGRLWLHRGEDRINRSLTTVDFKYTFSSFCKDYKDNYKYWESGEEMPKELLKDIDASSRNAENRAKQARFEHGEQG